jgi:hypothetical protein
MLEFESTELTSVENEFVTFSHSWVLLNISTGAACRRIALWRPLLMTAPRLDVAGAAAAASASAGAAVRPVTRAAVHT